MPDLPIYPQKREAPEYALERRLNRLLESDRESYRDALDAVRARCARETLRLTASSKEGDTDNDELVRAQLEALAVVESAASSAKDLDTNVVRAVHRAANLGADGGFRESDVAPQFQNARPSPARFVEAKLENLLEWLSGESGKDMFAAARMALWFARFVEIAPFERGNFRTAHLLTNFFAVRAGFPPATLVFEDAESIRDDVERAIRFDTGPLVGRFVGALENALQTCEEASARESE